MRSSVSGGSHLILERRIDAGHEALAGRLFVSAGPVDLAGQIQARDLLVFERAFQLRGVDGVVFNGVAGAEHLGRFEAGDGGTIATCTSIGRAGAHAVDVDLVSLEALRLQKELVLVLVRKSCTILSSIDGQ